MEDVGAVEPLALLNERFRPDHFLDRRQADDEAEHVGLRRVLEPEIVHARDAVARAEDHVDEVIAAMDLPEPVRKRNLGVVPKALEGLAHARTVLRLHEDVDTLRVARPVRIMRTSDRSADQKGYV